MSSFIKNVVLFGPGVDLRPSSVSEHNCGSESSAIENKIENIVFSTLG